MKKPNDNDATLLLRLPTDLKAALERQAELNGRRITAEVNFRLRESLAKQPASPRAAPLPASYTTSHATPPELAQEKGPANALTDIDRAMLAVFHTLPPEKQLALLSLFK